MRDLQGLAHYPFVLCMASFLLLWLLGWIAASRFADVGAWIRDEHAGYSAIQGATLTLLGLIIGFTFSMALNRYDQRKNLEEAEANAIGTEYLRVDFLPDAEAANAKALLVRYLDERIRFYTTRDMQELVDIDERTAGLQGDLWTLVQKAATTQPNPVMATVVTGMNDVLNSQGYTLAAWRNRIPSGAWWLMMAIAACATISVGLGLHKSQSRSRLLPILPLIVSMALFLTADIDTPRHGVIRVVPQNLLTQMQTMQPRLPRN